MGVRHLRLEQSIQLTLRVALAALSSVILLAVCLLLGSSRYLGDRLDTVYADRVVPLRDLERIVYLLNVEMPQGLSDAQAPRRTLQAQWDQLDGLWRKYLATYLTPEEEALAGRAGQQISELRRQLDGQPGVLGVASYHQRLLPLNATLNALCDLQVRVAEAALLEARSATRWTWGLGLAIAGLGLGLIGLAVHFVARRIVMPIRASAQAIEALAEGQLSLPAPTTALLGEFAAIGEQLHRLQLLLVERTRLLEEEQQTTLLLRSAQADLVEAEKMASLGALVAGVAHELNTPLGVAVAVSSTLSDKARRFAADLAAGPLRRSQLDAFVAHTGEAGSLLESNVQRAAELIRSFKQVAVDRTGMQRRRFELCDTVGEVIMSMRPAYGRHGVELVNEVPPGILVDSYPGALGQVVGNLLVNAVVHGLRSQPGTVRVTVSDPQADPLELNVIDDGAGMTDAVRAHAFEPFFTTRMGQGGSGLGLSIVRNIVGHVLGGRISLHSAPGEGCRATVLLPRRAPDAEAGQAATTKIVYAAH